MILLAALLVLTFALVVVLVPTIRHDGYGSRPAPRSHHDSLPGLDRL